MQTKYNKSLNKKLLNKANKLGQAGYIDQAVEMLVKGIQHDPEYKAFYYAIAEILLSAQQYEDALGILNKIPDVESDIRALEYIGYCFEGLEDYLQAALYADKVLAMAGESASALNLKGLLAYHQNDFDNAELFFKRAISANPVWGLPHTNMGLLKLKTDLLDQAIALLEKGFTLSPEIDIVNSAYHTVISDTGNFNRAELLFCKAIKSYPGHKQLSYLYIDILIQQSRYVEAIKAIEYAIAAFGLDDGIIKPALKIRQELGPLEIDKSSNLSPSVSLCMIVKNEEKNLAKSLNSVKPIIDEIIIVDTGSTDSTMEIAEVFGAKVFEYKWQDDFAGARNYSLSKASGDWVFVLDADEVVSAQDYHLFYESINRKCACEFITRNYTDDVGTEGWQANKGEYIEEEAGAGWNSSKKVRLFPNFEMIQFENRVHETVEGSLRKNNIEIKKCNLPIHHYGKLNSDRIDLKRKKYHSLSKAKLKENENDPAVLAEYAIQAGELGEYQKAIEIWQRVIELLPDLALAFFNLGYAYLQLDQYNRALKASIRAIELDPELKEAVLNQSICELRVGDVKNAVFLLEKFLHKDPDHPMAKGILAVALCVIEEKEQSKKLFDEVKKRGFDCSAYIYEHAVKLKKTGRQVYAAKLVNMAVENGFANQQIKALFNENMSKCSSDTRIKIFLFDIKDILPAVSDQLDPIPEHQVWDPQLFLAVNDMHKADFIIFPYSIDKIYHDLNYNEFRYFLFQLPWFSEYQHKFVFFIKDDISSALNLKSVIYKVNHEKSKMDLNSITLPYFIDDVFLDFFNQPNYHINFAGTIITHSIRALMLLPFIRKEELAAYDTVLAVLDNLISVRKNQQEYETKMLEAVRVVESLFPKKIKLHGISYYFDISVEQYPRLPLQMQEERKKRAINAMNQSIATLCPRGFGVQSIRFFETLSACRIPILISDNYVLPLEDKINYSSFICRVAEKEIMKSPTIISAFFNANDKNQMKKRCELGRDVWEKYFSKSKISEYLYLTLSQVLLKDYCLNNVLLA